MGDRFPLAIAFTIVENCGFGTYCGEKTSTLHCPPLLDDESTFLF